MYARAFRELRIVSARYGQSPFVINSCYGQSDSSDSLGEYQRFQNSVNTETKSQATMSAEEAKERRNFLAAYHLLKFSKADKDDTEAADIERRCLAAKYLSAREFDSVETASRLLRRSLEDYQTLMENKNGVNNYWKQFKAQTQNIENDPRKWKSGLEDVETVLGFAKPLPCQQKNTLPCKEINLTDRDVENIVNIWKNKQASGRQRKISCQEKSKLKEETESDRSRYNAGSGSQPNPFIPDVSMEDSSGEVSNTSRQLSRFHSVPNESQNLAGQRSVNRPQFRPAKEQYTVTSNKNEKPNIYRSNAKLKPQMCAQQNEEDTEPRNKFSAFRSARDELSIQQMKSNRPGQKKTLGGKGSLSAQFVCPLKKEKEKAMQARENSCEGESGSGEMEDERLKNIEPKMVELIKNEIMDSKTATTWNDIAGLEYAKKIIMEVVVYPMLRPDIFTGLRRPPKGILLFGPPGTGKTLIGKCIASQSKSTFFSISASSLTSKWIGEGEKMVRALFAVARVYQPAVVFVDEIDSLLTQRSETEHESSRRLKTEFLVQLDGAATAEDDRILIVGATNRPQELDEAARRRLVKRLYVPLPEFGARKQIISKLLLSVPHNLTEEDVTEIAERSRGYSGADMTNLCKEASMGPIRSIPFSQLENIRKEDVRQVTIDDFKEALIHVRPSVSESSISAYVEWDSIYGTGTAQNYTA